MILLLKCRHCGNSMKYSPSSPVVSDKSKKCVYCGKNFKIRDAVLKKISN